MLQLLLYNTTVKISHPLQPLHPPPPVIILIFSDEMFFFFPHASVPSLQNCFLCVCVCDVLLLSGRRRSLLLLILAVVSHCDCYNLWPSLQTPSSPPQMFDFNLVVGKNLKEAPRSQRETLKGTNLTNKKKQTTDNLFTACVPFFILIFMLLSCCTFFFFLSAPKQLCCF